LDELLDHIDVVLPWLQCCQSLVDIGAAAFHDERLKDCEPNQSQLKVHPI
jgi:hypothetical protein